MRYKKRKGNNIGAVLSMNKFVDKKDARIRSYSIVDMILDPSKKKEADDYYSSQYQYVEKDDFAKKLFKKNDNCMK